MTQTSRAQKLPSWLPTVVAEFVRACENNTAIFNGAIWSDEKLRARLLRLAVQPRMEKVWQTFAKTDLNPDMLTQASIAAPKIKTLFLQTYLWHAVCGPQVLTETPPLRIQREKVKEVSRLARDLLKALEETNCPVDAFSSRWKPWNLLNRAVFALRQNKVDESRGVHLRGRSLHALMNRVGTFGEGHFWEPQPVDGDTSGVVLPSADTRMTFLPLVYQLHALAKLAKLAETLAVPRPAKTTPNLDRNALARELALDVRQYLDSPCRQAIATTVNVALDLVADNELTDDMMRKL